MFFAIMSSQSTLLSKENISNLHFSLAIGRSLPWLPFSNVSKRLLLAPSNVRFFDGGGAEYNGRSLSGDVKTSFV